MQRFRLLRFLLLPILIGFFYNGLLMHNYGKLRTRTIATNYWSYQADAFLNGRLDIKECPPYSDCHDLVFFEGKKYLYWSPVPALVYLPLVAKFGTQTPDELIASIIGTLNIFVFSVFLYFFSRYFQLKMSFWENQFWTLFWGMGTVHFYMSMNGTVWYIAQLLAQTFLLISFTFLLKNIKSKRWLFVSGLCLALACYTRNNLIFAYCFAIGFFISSWSKEDWKVIVIKFSIFISSFVLASLANLYYNFIRFGNAFENGLNYHKMDYGYQINFDQYGYFSWRYIPSNFWIEVLKPPKWISTFPFFDIENGYGFGLFWVSPLFLFFIPSVFLFLNKIIKSGYGVTQIISNKKQTALLGNFVALLGISLIIFLVMGPGWKQFASRYSLDYQLFLIIPILFFFEKRKKSTWIKSLAFFLLLISIYMNYFGARVFYDI